MRHHPTLSRTSRRRRGALVGCGALLATLLLPVTTASAAPATRTATTTSLPTVTSGERPGPELLYAPPPAAPQLENAGVWTAAPVLVGGASAYRSGEFLYQDFLYDDLGASSRYAYPTDPSYAGNAADLVEVRVRPVSGATAIRLTYNSMLDPSLVATTIALGDSTVALPLPHGANTKAPGQVFVTVHGSSADAVSATTGLPVTGAAPTAVVDRLRRQVEVRVPHGVFDPTGKPAVRLAAASGLWDAAAGRYLVPQAVADSAHPGGATGSAPSAFFNAAFRYDEPLLGSVAVEKREAQQASVLASGDLSPFFALVDFTRLASGVGDELVGKRGGAPKSGFLNRIFASRFETRQGRGDAYSLRPEDCTVPCAPLFAGQLQSYSVYVPDLPLPTAGFGLTLALHASGGTANSYQGSAGAQRLGDRGTGSIVLTPEARGPSYWYYGQAAADVFEAWADAARHYLLDPSNTAIVGSSMGGYGTYKLAAMFPDLFAAAVPVVPCPTGETRYVPGTPSPGGEASAIVHMTPSYRHVPTSSYQSANDPICTYPQPNGNSGIIGSLDTLDYRYEARTFWGPEHALVGNILLYQGQEIAAFLEAHRVTKDPSHVTLAVNTHMSEPAKGLTADHAYWVSDVRLAQGTNALPVGTVDVVSGGFGLGDPPPSATQYDQGVYQDTPYVYTKQWKAPGEQPAQPVANILKVTTKNVASLTIDPVRARVGCDALVEVVSSTPVTVTLAGCAVERKRPGKKTTDPAPDPEPEPGSDGSVPTQLISKAYTESLGRLPSQAEWQDAVAQFRTTGCSATAAAAFSRAVLLSPEYEALGYDAAARVLTLFRAGLNREPDPATFATHHDALKSGAAWSAVVDEVLTSPEYVDALVPRICGESPAYGFGDTPAMAIPTTGTGFAGGGGHELQALLDAAAPGQTVWLAQKALVEVQQPLVVPAGVTLATTGQPGPARYASLGRLVRAATFSGEVVRVNKDGGLDSVWIDGQRGVPPRVGVAGVSTPSEPALSDAGLGQGSYTTTARNTPGITNTINVSLLGGRVVDSVLSSSSGWTAMQTGTQDGSVCTATITGNLVTAYTSDHATIFSDGISNYCDDAIIEHNEVVDTTDVGIIIFPPSSLLQQRSQVRYNTVLQAGNDAYGAYVSDGTLSNKTQPPDFTGSLVHDNLMWTGGRTHVDIGLSVGTRAWFGPNSATSIGSAFVSNTTGTLSARVATGIAVSGMVQARVVGNTLRTVFAEDASPCPRVRVGAQVSTGHASGDIQPYTDAVFDSCIRTGD